MTRASARDVEFEAGMAHHRLAAKYLSAGEILYRVTIPEGASLLKTMFAEYEPLVFLCCHSMELNFKSYLIAHGCPIKQAEAFGHDLGKLARECCAEGMALPDWTSKVSSLSSVRSSRTMVSKHSQLRAALPVPP